VGSVLAGNGRWGHRDLAGSMQEWVLDYYVFPYPDNSCTDCTVLDDAGHGRVARGGNWSSVYDADLRAGTTGGEQPESHLSTLGFRCARDGN